MEQIGRKIVRLESVDSTNNYTANLIKGGELVHGSVIMAVEQTNGRGQMGAEWLVKPGENLTFSVFLDNVNLSVNYQFFLTRLVSVSLVDFLAKFNIPTAIKWPNDIYVNDKKIAGILIENKVSGSFIQKSIIGIGLNVNQSDFGNLEATSLFLKTGIHRSIDDVLFSFIKSLNTILEGGLTNPKLEDAYLKRLHLLNEKSSFEDKEGLFEGTILGVAPNGRLRVEKSRGEVHYSLKEIRFIR
ncbi:MAG: biotin--[acetyl-CoA-carboxylase] ligase [Crocinitomicaceae bacterium]|nr:biotin--[acetyl-CoA-carboxylase] ligase [Crocinitomicaceae bacterium]